MRLDALRTERTGRESQAEAELHPLTSDPFRYKSVHSHEWKGGEVNRDAKDDFAAIFSPPYQ